MSSHYLVDLFTPITFGPPIVSTAAILAVTEPPNGQTLANGAFVVRLPATSSLVDPTTGLPAVPTNLAELISFKYQGLLSFFSGYENVIYDDLLDTSGINLSAAGLAGSLGQRSTIALNPGATLTSKVQTLLSTPTNAILTWEVFEYLDADPSAGLHQRTYQELPTTGTYTTAQVSLNNGGTFIAATDSGVFNIPTADQGNQLIVQITNASSSRLQIGSWAVIY